MIADWKKEIAVAFVVQNEIDKLDIDHIWKYFLPKVRVTEQELIRTETILGKRLDPEYRNFLTYANGWRCFHLNIDLFGTEELTGIVEMQKARFLLDELAPNVLEKSRVKRSDLFPIAVASRDLDVFAIWPSRGDGPGEVIWFANEEVERYATFDHYFLAMVDYNRGHLERFRKGEIRIKKET